MRWGGAFVWAGVAARAKGAGRHGVCACIHPRRARQWRRRHLGAWHWLEKSCAGGKHLTGVRGWRQVPYSSYVETTAYKQQPDGSVRIEQTIFVETEGQKKILVGMIKDLGTKARSEMIKFLGCNVHLFLQVSPAPAPVASRLRLA